MASSSSASAAAATCDEFDLGPVGSLLRMNLPKGGQKTAKSYNILILDRSGSMGQWCKRISSDAVPRGLRALGCADNDKILVITFDSKTESQEFTVRGLAASSLTSRGTTQMTPVVPLVERALTTHANDPVRLIVVSDGAVSDAEKLVAAAKNMALKVSHARSAPVEVVLIRAMTSSYAAPDTRALACFGVLNEATSTPVVDVHCSTVGPEAANQQIADIIKDGFTSVGGSWEVSASSACLRRMPGATPQSKLTLPPGSSYILLDAGASSDSVKLRIADCPLTVRKATLQSEGDLREFLELIESQIRMRMVSGSGETRDMLSWCRALSEHVSRVMEEAERASSAAAAAAAGGGAESEAMLTLKDRARQLRKEIERTEKSMLGRILSLANADAIAGFTAAQQADFLRQGAADTKAARSLAKRAVKGGMVAPEDFDGQAQQALAKLAEAAGAGDDALTLPRHAPTSFYSACAFDEAFEAAAELGDVADSLSFGKVMEMAGGVGLAFEGPVGEFVDPWAYRVTRVYTGMALSQQDLWMAHQQGGGKQLKFPGMGDDAVVTGVDLVRAPHPRLYDAYIRAAGVVNAMHASAFMRRKVAMIPYDTLALKAACTFRLVQQLPREAPPPTTLVRALVTEVLDCHHALSTYAAKYLAQLADDLQRLGNIGAYLTGDLDINGVLKPLLVLLADPRVGAMVAKDPVATARALRAIHGADCYQAVRYQCREPEDRTKALEKMLAINYDQHGIAVGEPGTPDPESPQHYAEVSPADCFTRCTQLLPRQTAADYAAVVACRRALGPLDALDKRLREALAADGNEPDSPLLTELAAALHKELGEVTNKTAFGLDCPVQHMVAAHTAQAIQSPNLESRVTIEGDKRTYRLPDIDSADAALAYLQQCQRSLYQADYDRRLREKRAVEKERAMAMLVDELCSLDDMRAWVTKLGAGIADRSSPGYASLEEALLTRAGVTARARKLWIVVSGRSANGRPVWCAGNVMRGDLSRFEKAILAEEHGKAVWAKLSELLAEHSRHTYRGDNANRHGHSNACPSWWALGYASRNAYRAAVGEAEFAKYEAARIANGGSSSVLAPPPPISAEEKKTRKAEQRRLKAARAKAKKSPAAAAGAKGGASSSSSSKGGKRR